MFSVSAVRNITLTSLPPSPLQHSLYFPALWTWTFYALHCKWCAACVLSRLAHFTWLSSWATTAVERSGLWFFSKADSKHCMYRPLLPLPTPPAMCTWVDSPFEILRIMLCSWMYKYIFQSRPCSFRHAHMCAGPHGKCTLNLGLGIHTRISILTGFWTGLPSFQQFTRLLFLPTQAVQATFCPANQGHPDGSISPCTRSLRWLVVLSTLYLFAQ